MKTVIGNWKMNKTLPETLSFLEILKKDPVIFNTNAWIAPPFTALYGASKAVLNTPIKIGAQNISIALSGAFTGEISPTMLLDAGAQFVIIGHSERRTLFQETNEVIAKKCELALKAGLQIVLCVGETKDERDASMTKKVIEKQLTEALEKIDKTFSKKVMIAYEPLWAIGTGHFASRNLVEEIHLLCKNRVAAHFGIALEEVPLLYGGSVNSKNCEEFLKSNLIDGLLVGGASLEVSSFIEILKIASNCRLGV